MSKASGFGRDEMTALLGGDVSESLTRSGGVFPGGGVGSSSNSTHHNSKNGIAVADMTTAQTAAMLKQQDLEKAQKKQSAAVGRLRAQKKDYIPQHYALLMEEKQRQQRQQHENQGQSDKDKDNSNSSSDDEEEGDEFVRKQTREPRKKMEPQIVVQRQKVEAQVVVQQRRRRRRRGDSSSSSDNSSDSDNNNGGGKDKGSSSDSSDDDRRQRLLAKRRKQTAEVITTAEVNNTKSGEKMESTAGAASTHHNSERHRIEPVVVRSNQKKESSSSGSNSGSSSDDDDDSSDESSEDEAPVVMAKPLFVPKHKRHLIISQEQRAHEEALKREKLKQQEEQRKLKSRTMVMEIVSAANVSTEPENDNDEGGGAMNAMPRDDDPTDPIELELERDAWEVRELARLLRTQDLVEEEAEERAEYNRRVKMTDEERLLEDAALGLYQAPGTQRGGESGTAKRYFHRGAFYMDQEEWDKDDVRYKAKEYERAATGEDKIDKRNLPKVMQVKKFGFARQNTKYKGLSNEDTTDKSTRFLPLVSKKQRDRR